MDGAVLPWHSSLQCVCSSPCNFTFFPSKMSLRICPVGQRLLWPELLAASLSTWYAAWARYRVSSATSTRTPMFLSALLLSSVSCWKLRCFQAPVVEVRLCFRASYGFAFFDLPNSVQCNSKVFLSVCQPDHAKMNIAFVGNAGHFDNEINLACSEVLEGLNFGNLEPREVVPSSLFHFPCLDYDIRHLPLKQKTAHFHALWI